MTTPKARYEITADDKTAAAWRSSLNNAKKFNSELNNVFKGAASFAGMSIGINQVGDALGKAIQRGDGLLRLSERMGTTVEYLSKLEYGAGKADVEFDKLTGGLDTMSKNVSMAAQGMGKAQQALKDLGLDAQKLNNLSLDQRVEKIADAMAGLAKASDKTRISMQLYGDADFVSIFGDGADAVRAFTSQAEKAGHVMSTLTARELAAADDAMKELNATWKDLTTTAAVFWVGVGKNVGLIPTSELEQYNNKLNDLFGKIEQMQEYRDSFREDGFFAKAMPDTAKKHFDDLTASIAKTRAELNALAKEKYLKFEMPNDDGSGEKRRNMDPATKADMEETFKWLEKLTAGDQALQEVRVTGRRKEQTAMEEYYARLDELTQTQDEKTSAAFTAELAALEELLKEKLIKEDVYQTRLAEIQDKYLPEQQVTLRKIVERNEAATSEMTKHWETFSERAQGAMADFLFDPFEDGLDGMFNKFVGTLRRMAAEKAAQKIFDEVDDFDWGSLGGFLSGLAGTNGSAASSGGSWSGPRAKGGPVMAGGGYLVGEEGPEFFAPSTNGFIIPNDALRNSSNNGNVIINQTYNVSGNGVTRAEVIAISEQGRKSAIAEIRDIKRRGRF